jgi:hypothetical protein
MNNNFIQVSGENFTVNGEPILLRGYSLGSWMNLEHFMIGLPGTNSMIHDAFTEVYGEDRAKSFFETFLDQFIKEEDIIFLKNMGINSIRIPFGYHYFVDDRNPDGFLEWGFQLLDRVINLCGKHKIYTILDLHSTPGSQNTDWTSDNITGQALFWRYRCFQDQVVALWREMAFHYRDNPWVAGYDVLNEPGSGYGLTKGNLNSFYARVTAAIRETDKSHIIFLEGEDYGKNFDLFDEPEDPQVAYTVHFYPFVSEEKILDPALDESRRNEIVKLHFFRYLKMRDKLRRPFWCGESGYWFPEGQEEFYSKLIINNLRLFEDNNISWSLWTYKDARKMGIVILRENSPWANLRCDVEKVWSHGDKDKSLKITREIGERYYQPLENKLLYDLEPRIRSVMHQIAVEQILKPRLQSVPWEEMEKYPYSFSYENCDRRDVIIRDITTFIAENSKNQIFNDEEKEK